MLEGIPPCGSSSWFFRNTCQRFCSLARRSTVPIGFHWPSETPRDRLCAFAVIGLGDGGQVFTWQWFHLSNFCWYWCRRCFHFCNHKEFLLHQGTIARPPIESQTASTHNNEVNFVPLTKEDNKDGKLKPLNPYITGFMWSSMNH